MFWSARILLMHHISHIWNHNPSTGRRPKTFWTWYLDMFQLRPYSQFSRKFPMISHACDVRPYHPWIPYEQLWWVNAYPWPLTLRLHNAYPFFILSSEFLLLLLLHLHQHHPPFPFSFSRVIRLPRVFLVQIGHTTCTRWPNLSLTFILYVIIIRLGRFLCPFMHKISHVNEPVAFPCVYNKVERKQTHE